MAAIDGLAEVAGQALQAESAGRAVTWRDQAAIDDAVAKVATSLARDRESPGRPSFSALRPSVVWRDRLAAMVDPTRDDRPSRPPGDPITAAARAEADADTAVAVAVVVDRGPSGRARGPQRGAESR